MLIIIGSNSDRKIKVARKILNELASAGEIEVKGHPALSGVPETPYDKQTFDGAKNRAIHSRENVPGGDYYIGIESGLIERYGHTFEEAWVAVISNDGKEYFGYSSGLKVPDLILKRMDTLNLEHCDVMTQVEEEFGKLPNDTWGTYSGGAISREVSLGEALRNAFIQIIAPDASLYKK